MAKFKQGDKVTVNIPASVQNGLRGVVDVVLPLSPKSTKGVEYRIKTEPGNDLFIFEDDLKAREPNPPKAGETVWIERCGAYGIVREVYLWCAAVEIRPWTFSTFEFKELRKVK